MTDGGAMFQPGRGEASVAFQPRSAFVAHEAFGHDAGAVLVAPDVARDLRRAAEYATQERRITGGLLYGRRWADDEGPYLVVDGFLESDNRHDRISSDGHDAFTLPAEDLVPLRRDADRMYSATVEVGWWRTLEGPGEFGPRDFETQRELVRPGGVGLLVFGVGLDWGTAYLGPDGQVPGSARSFIPVPRPVPPPPPLPAPGPVSGAEPEVEPEPDAEPVTTVAPGTALATRRQATLTPAPQPTGSRVISPVPKPAREWGVKPPNPSHAGPEMPTDVKIVIGALILTAIVAAIIIGLLVSNALVAVIVGVVLLLGLFGFLWMARR
jgi:hypothetical protein